MFKLKDFLFSNLKLWLFVFILNSLSQNIFSQYITPVELNAGGNEIISGNVIFTSSIGGFAVTTFLKDSIYLTQGYQQLDSSLTSNAGFDNKIVISAFPNPCVHFVSISLKNLENPTNCTFELYSSLGKSSRIFTNILMVNNIPFRIGISNFDSGLYVIKISEQNSKKPIGLIKILKLKESK